MIDLKTEKNALSVWRIEDDKSDLDDVISAVAATRHDPAPFDYALLNENALAELEIECERTTGKTPYVEANSKHLDLVKLSGERLVSLGEAIQTGPPVFRILWKQVAAMLVQAVQAGKIRLESLKDNVREKLVPQLGTEENTRPS